MIDWHEVKEIIEDLDNCRSYLATSLGEDIEKDRQVLDQMEFDVAWLKGVIDGHRRG